MRLGLGAIGENRVLMVGFTLALSFGIPEATEKESGVSRPIPAIAPRLVSKQCRKLTESRH